MPVLAKNCFTDKASSSGALSSCRINESFFQKYNLFFNAPNLLDSNSSVVCLINVLSFSYPNNHDNTLHGEKNNQNYLQFWFTQSFLPCGDRMTLLYRVVLENVFFITYDDISDQVCVLSRSLHDVQANILPVVFWLLNGTFRDIFCPNFVT